jgi:hypothetical protein
MSSQRFVLAIMNNGHTPQSRVCPIDQIEIIGGTDEDILSVELDGMLHCKVKGPGIHDVVVPSGLLRLLRESGNSPLTIFGYGTPSSR